MEKLIEMLDAMMASGNYDAAISEEDGCIYLGGDAATEINCVAADLFVGLNGSPDREAIEYLKELSNGRYWAAPGGPESFEFAAGCIHTPAGVIIYG